MRQTKIYHCREIPLKNFFDKRGMLQVIEDVKDLNNKCLTFKRIYLLKDLKADLERGVHAHKKLYQLFLVLNGSCTLNLFDGENSKTIDLNEDKALLLVPGIWRELRNFTKNMYIIVLASELYSEEDYIFFKEDFIKYKKNH